MEKINEKNDIKKVSRKRKIASIIVLILIMLVSASIKVKLRTDRIEKEQQKLVGNGKLVPINNRSRIYDVAKIFLKKINVEMDSVRKYVVSIQKDEDNEEYYLISGSKYELALNMDDTFKAYGININDIKTSNEVDFSKEEAIKKADSYVKALNYFDKFKLAEIKKLNGIWNAVYVLKSDTIADPYNIINLSVNKVNGLIYIKVYEENIPDNLKQPSIIKKDKAIDIAKKFDKDGIIKNAEEVYMKDKEKNIYIEHGE